MFWKCAEKQPRSNQSCPQISTNSGVNWLKCVGPSIGPQNYEVGPEFVERFVRSDDASERFFVPSARAGHALFDLRGYTLLRLERAGAEAQMVARCTYALEGEFYSYRRATHRNEPDYGRQVSAIVMENR